MAANSKMTTQKKTPRIYRRKVKRTVIINHKIIERIIPPIPSPTSGGSNSNPSSKGILSAAVLLFFYSEYFTFSFSFKPKYKPKLIKRKKATAKIEVDKIEF
jgi:hypothetical protein